MKSQESQEAQAQAQAQTQAQAQAQTLSLTKSQEHALTGIIGGIKSQGMLDLGVYSLVGAAGTGKTFLTNLILDKIYEQDKNAKVALLSPTHKALANLEEHTRNCKNTVIYATLHSYLGLKMSYDKDGTQRFIKGKKRKAQSVNYIILDEASFVDISLYTFLQDYLMMNAGITALIYVGDKCQLSPVDRTDKLSPVFDQVKNTFVLDEVIRNGDTTILDFFTKIRRLINIHDDFSEKGTIDEYTAKIRDKFNSLVKGEFARVTPTSKIQFIEDIAQTYIENNDEKALVVSYTNHTVDYLNSKIRKHFRPACGKFPEVQETLVMQNSVENKFMNNESVQVKDVKDGFETIGHLQIQVKEIHVQSSSGLVKFSVPNGSDAVSNLLKYKEALKTARRWPEFYKLDDTFAIFKYKYACTIHKSQGSTCTDVYVDLTGLLDVPMSLSQLLRLFYVASSRASNRIYLAL